MVGPRYAPIRVPVGPRGVAFALPYGFAGVRGAFSVDRLGARRVLDGGGRGVWGVHGLDRVGWGTGVVTCGGRCGVWGRGPRFRRHPAMATGCPVDRRGLGQACAAASDPRTASTMIVAGWYRCPHWVGGDRLAPARRGACQVAGGSTSAIFAPGSPQVGSVN